MKALYMNGSTRLTDEERDTYSGFRIENAHAFRSISGKVESAVVAGVFPAVTDALDAAGIEYETVELQGDADAPVVDTDDSGDDESPEPVFDVFKVNDGIRAEHASKHNITQAEAEAFVAKKPDVEYEIVADAG